MINQRIKKKVHKKITLQQRFLASRSRRHNQTNINDTFYIVTDQEYSKMFNSPVEWSL